MTRKYDRRSEIEHELAALFGAEVDWHRESGVVHVAAIGARPRAALAIGPGSPTSPTDRFVLGFARARADAIVTTSAILRSEPGLVHRTSDDPAEEAVWQRWRADVLGRRDAPLCVVVSQTGGLSGDHPSLRALGGATIVTTRAGRSQLAGSVGGLEVVVVDEPERGGGGIPGARAGAPATRKGPDAEAREGASSTGAGPELLLSRAIDWLRRARGAQTIVLEAGPRSTVGLYGVEAPGAELARVDELLLSVFDGGPFDAVGGPELPGSDSLARYFGGTPGAGPQTRRRRQEPSGSWDFERYRRVT